MRIIKRYEYVKSLFIISVIVIVWCINFIGCTNKKSSNIDKVIKETEKTQISSFTELVYASKDRVILNGDVSLIVYDLHNQKIDRAVDIKSIDMNHIQGDIVTIFKVNSKADQILMYNSSLDNSDNNKYLYDIENDTLCETNINSFDDEYDGKKQFDEIDTYNNEYIKKHSGMECIDYKYIDKNNVCFLMHSRKYGNLKGISHLKILQVNMETGEEE